MNNAIHRTHDWPFRHVWIAQRWHDFARDMGLESSMDCRDRKIRVHVYGRPADIHAAFDLWQENNTR